MERQLLTKRDVAEMLGIGPLTVDAWAKKGQLPAPLKLTARTVRFRRCDIEDYFGLRRDESEVVRCLREAVDQLAAEKRVVDTEVAEAREQKRQAVETKAHEKRVRALFGQAEGAP